MGNTADTATGFQGDKLYQKWARLALPVSIRQAKAGQPVSYEDLAAELGMPNPRNLNHGHRHGEVLRDFWPFGSVQVDQHSGFSMHAVLER